MATITAKVDKDTAMEAVCIVLSKAIIYGDEFDYDYTDGVLTMTYNSKNAKKAQITDSFEK